MNHPRLRTIAKVRCEECGQTFRAVDHQAPRRYRAVFEWYANGGPPPQMLRRDRFPTNCPACRFEPANRFPDLLAQLLEYRRNSWQLALQTGVAAG
jgi:hypothetical protein